MKNSKPNISILTIALGSGGAEKVISLLLKHLVNDYNVTLILLYKEIHFPIPKEVNVIFLSNKKPGVPFYTKAFDFFNFNKKYQEYILKYNIQIAVSFLALPNLINGILSGKNNNVKTIISERGFPSDNTSSKLSLYISKLFYPIYYNKCTKLFSNSVYINKDLKENFGVTIPMDVIYNPIEVPEKTIIPEHLNKESQPLKIITAGTLNKRKNQIMIIKALIDTNNQFKLTILGGGPLQDYLLTEIESNNLTNQVVLGGKVKNVNNHFLNNDCFVLSSFTEGFPNALLEAMAIGLPTISTNCFSGPLELLNDNHEVTIKEGEFVKAKYGILINNDDHVALKKALLYYNNNPKEREKYSALSLMRSKDYTLPNIYSKFHQFLKN